MLDRVLRLRDRRDDARAHADQAQREYAQAVAALFDAGLSIGRIAAALGTTRSEVQRLINAGR